MKDLTEEQKEIIKTAGNTYLCRTYHQHIITITSLLLGTNKIDPNKCEFGNDEEHIRFFKEIK